MTKRSVRRICPLAAHRGGIMLHYDDSILPSHERARIYTHPPRHNRDVCAARQGKVPAIENDIEAATAYNCVARQ
jgi:hypothetical protein